MRVESLEHWLSESNACCASIKTCMWMLALHIKARYVVVNMAGGIKTLPAKSDDLSSVSRFTW